MAVIEGITKNDRKLFILGILAALAGGLLSNLLAAFIMELLKLQPQPSWAVIFEFFIVFGGFVVIIYLLFKELDKIDKE